MGQKVGKPCEQRIGILVTKNSYGGYARCITYLRYPLYSSCDLAFCYHTVHLVTAKITPDRSLVFKSTGNKPHSAHVTDTKCKPDYTAAFETNWGDDNTTLWPCISQGNNLLKESPATSRRDKPFRIYIT